MPSDPRLDAALSAVAPGIQAFRAVIADAIAQVDRQLQGTCDAQPQQRVAAELGDFGATRIDAERFASILAGARTLDAAELSVLRDVRAVLTDFERVDASRFVVDVPAGAHLGLIVGAALAEFGRAFGAVLVAELVRAGRYSADAHQQLLRPVAPSRWAPVHRAASPPLVITIDGADLRAGDLAPYVDGAQKFVLVVREPCPAAPLVRLVTPGVLVIQTTATAGVAAVTNATTPVVLALVPQGVATFTHLPLAAVPVHERLTVTFMPPQPRRMLGDWSAFQQQQELLQLAALAAKPPIQATDGQRRDEPAATDPVDRLAAWLLTQAGNGAAA